MIEGVEDEVAAEPGRREPEVVHGPEQPVGGGVPAGLGRAVTVVVVVKIVLIEKARSNRGEHHLGAGGTAIVVGVLLVVRDDQVFRRGHRDPPALTTADSRNISCDTGSRFGGPRRAAPARSWDRSST